VLSIANKCHIWVLYRWIMIWVYTNLHLLNLLHLLYTVYKYYPIISQITQVKMNWFLKIVHTGEILYEIFLITPEKYAACLPDQNVSPKSGCLQKLLVTILYKRYPESQQMAVAAVTDFVLFNCEWHLLWVLRRTTVNTKAVVDTRFPRDKCLLFSKIYLESMP